MCDGAAVSRTQYDELFGVIGTTYGAGDGSRTFNLPNLIDRFPQGNKTVGGKVEAGLPNINGDLMANAWIPGENPTGAFANKRQKETIIINQTPKQSDADWGGIDFNASRSSAIYGRSTTVQPPALKLLPIIKV